MKKKYLPPFYTVTVIYIEDSLCNASSTLIPSNLDSDIVSEWEELPDDERTFTW